jgi:hypothetical protein
MPEAFFGPKYVVLLPSGNDTTAIAFVSAFGMRTATGAVVDESPIVNELRPTVPKTLSVPDSVSA